MSTDNTDELLIQLAIMFEERSEVYDEYTSMIFELIEPTLLTALIELFEIDNSKVLWNTITIENNTIIISCTLFYNPDEAIPTVIQRIIPNEIITKDGIKGKKVRIGFPVSYVFFPKHKIIEYFRNIVGYTSDTESGVVDSTESELHAADELSLTEDQRLQILLFQQQTKGQIH